MQKSVILLLLKYFLCQVLYFATSQVTSVTKSHEKVMLNHVRVKQKENDRSAAAAEKRLLVCDVQPQEGRDAESSAYREVTLCTQLTRWKRYVLNMNIHRPRLASHCFLFGFVKRSWVP